MCYFVGYLFLWIEKKKALPNEVFLLHSRDTDERKKTGRKLDLYFWQDIGHREQKIHFSVEQQIKLSANK